MGCYWCQFAAELHTAKKRKQRYLSIEMVEKLFDLLQERMGVRPGRSRNQGIGGPILSAASYFMKSPPEQYSDSVAKEKVEQFIRGEGDH